MRDTLGIGLIGCGNIAHLHTAALRDLIADGMPVRPVMAADPIPSNRDAVSANLPFERFSDDATHVLDDPDVDAVFVCTPTATHEELYVNAVGAGKHLYAEKPIAPNLAKVRKIHAACKEASVITQVGFQLRFHSLLTRARDLLHSGRIGAPMAYFWRDDEAFPTTSVTSYATDWRSKSSLAGGGTLLEHSIHGVDVLHWLFGPTRTVGSFDRKVLGFEVEDTAALTLQHQSGVTGTLVSVYGGVKGREESRLEIYGEDGIIEITLGITVDAPEGSFRIQMAGQPPENIDPARVVTDHVSALGLERRPFFWNELSDRAFLESVLKGHPASPGVDEALLAHAVVESAYRSAAERRMVDIEEVLGVAPLP